MSTSSSAARTARSASSSRTEVGPPHAHDRVADELVDGAAEPFDDLAGPVEVDGEHVADVLGVAALGKRGVADDVGEQHRHEPLALNDGAARTTGRR